MNGKQPGASSHSGSFDVDSMNSLGNRCHLEFHHSDHCVYSCTTTRTSESWKKLLRRLSLQCLRSFSGGLENIYFSTSSFFFGLWLMDKGQRNSTTTEGFFTRWFFFRCRFIFQAYLDYCDRKGNLVTGVEHVSRCLYFHWNLGVVALV